MREKEMRFVCVIHELNIKHYKTSCMSLFAYGIEGVVKELRAGVGIPTPLTSSTKVAHMATTARQSRDDARICYTFIDRHTVKGYDRIVHAMYDQSWHSYLADPIKT